ncbi:MAG: glycosyltransferase family 39 protein [Planctomycetes bacterium]|nr:glycosyltransferase family 39 protein [Planctomycetota bacterium]
MRDNAAIVNLRKPDFFLWLAGIAIVAASWILSQDALAQFFLHPVRLNAQAHAMDSAAAARVGWTVVGLSLCLFPWLLRRAGRAAPNPSSTNTPPIFSKPLFVLLIVSLIVRLIRVNESLWYDEIASLATYVVHGPGVIMGNAFTTANHPLQSLLSWMSMPLSIDPGIRLPSILAGPVAVFGVWQFTRQVTSERVALVAAAAMAFAPAAVFASDEARGYALSFAFCSLANSMMLSMLQGTSRRRTAWWYALFMALATWAHFVAACLAVGHFLVLLWMLRLREQRAAAVSAIIAVFWAGCLSLGLWSPALPDLFHTREQFFAVTGNEPRFFKNGHMSDEAVMLILQFGGSYFSAALIGLPLAIWGLVAALRLRNLRLAFAVAGLGVPVALLAAWLGNSWLYARFLLFAMPATAFLLAVGLSSIWNFRRWIAVTWMAFVGVLWIGQIIMFEPKQPLREAVEFVAERKAPQDTVAIITPADNVGQWYALAHNFELLPTGQYGSELEACLRSTQPPPCWIVVLYPHSVPDSVNALLRHENYKAVSRRYWKSDQYHGFHGWVDWGRGVIDVWQRDPPATDR